MLRRLLIDAMSLSMLLCIGTGMFWLRSRSSVELLAVAHGNWPDGSRLYSGRALSFAAAEGRISLNFDRWGFDFSHPGEIDGSSARPNPLQYRRRGPCGLILVHQQHALTAADALPADWHGFAWRVNSFGNRGQWDQSRGLTLPAWLIMLLTALLPASGAIKTARRFLQEHPSVRRDSRFRRRHDSRIPSGAAIA